MGDEIEQLVRGMNILGIAAGEKKQAKDVAEATGVMQHFAQRDGLFIGRKFGNVLPNVIIEREVALLGSDHDAGGGKLLGDAAHVEDGFRSERDAKFEAGFAVSPLVD